MSTVTLETLAEGLEAIRGDISDLRDDLRGIKRSVAGVKSDVAGVNEEIGTLDLAVQKRLKQHRKDISADFRVALSGAENPSKGSRRGASSSTSAARA